jgi:hypothetical protein
LRGLVADAGLALGEVAAVLEGDRVRGVLQLHEEGEVRAMGQVT